MPKSKKIEGHTVVKESRRFTVHVTSNEGRKGGGGFYWFTDPAKADTDFDETVATIGHDANCFRFDIDVSYDPSNPTNQAAITKELEKRFMAINFEYDRLPLLRRS